MLQNLNNKGSIFLVLTSKTAGSDGRQKISQSILAEPVSLEQVWENVDVREPLVSMQFGK